jgi:hypothetical protein
MNQPPPFWQGLFAADPAVRPPTVVAMKLLTKRGKPLLLLPNQPPLATYALELYPAQTRRSRLARLAAQWLLRTRLPFAIDSVQVNLLPDDPFVRWLAQLVLVSQDQIPPFAVLAGNPGSPGQRLIILLFNPAGQPTAVVKAGLTEAARKLISREQQFLETVPRTFQGIPTLRSTFANERLQALALNFLPGRSPEEEDEHSLPRVLGQWLHPQKQVAFAETRVGQELATTCANHPIYKSHARRFQHQNGRAAVCHGDFAPWNVRVSPAGDWMVLDWERGEVDGLPAWDWFHYVVQKSILVQHQSLASLANTVEALLARDEFRAYAQASAVTGNERTLLLLYLLHQAQVVRPSEGLQATMDLMQHLAARWPQTL